MANNSIDTLKREAQDAPSKVAFRNLGQSGNNVSVRYYQGDLSYNDHYEWSHKGNCIKEHRAQELLNDLTSREQANQAPAGAELFRFADGHYVQRETGRVYLPKNGGLGVDAMGKWVLRDKDGNAVDMDKYQSDLFERWEDQIGKPLEDVTN